MRQIDRRITEAAGELLGISSLVVFGSRAAGRPRPMSDLDVGVLPDQFLREPAVHHLAERRYPSNSFASSAVSRRNDS